MFTKIAIGQLGGFLFLFILLTSVLSKVLAGAPLDPEKVPSALGAVAKGGKKFRIGIVVDLVSHISVVALAGVLFLTFSPYNQSLALIGTLWRVAEGIIITSNETNSILLLATAQKFVSTTGAEAGALEAQGRTLIQAEDWGLSIGLVFLALGHLLYAILFVSSGAVPTALSWWGVIASVLAATGIILSMIRPNLSSGIKAASFFPIILYEVGLGIWLLLQGGQLVAS